MIWLAVGFVLGILVEVWCKGVLDAPEDDDDFD